MKRKLVSLLLALLLLILSGCGSQPASPGNKEPDLAENNSQSDSSPKTSREEEAPTEKEEAAYEVTYSTARTYVNSIGTTYAVVMIEIENTGNTNLYLSSGSCDLEDASGKLITSMSLVSEYPSVIAPGEKGYMYEETILDDPVEGEVTVVPRPSVEKAKVDLIRYDVTDVAISNHKYGGLKALGRVENTSSEAGSLVHIAIVLKNAEGQPIGVMYTIMTEELKAGDKVGFEMTGYSLPDDITEDSVSSYEVFAYPLQMQF